MKTGIIEKYTGWHEGKACDVRWRKRLGSISIRRHEGENRWDVCDIWPHGERYYGEFWWVGD